MEYIFWGIFPLGVTLPAVEHVVLTPRPLKAVVRTVKQLNSHMDQIPSKAEAPSAVTSSRNLENKHKPGRGGSDALQPCVAQGLPQLETLQL